MKQQGGFTLIELIMVIVILGILAATALPKFVDLQNDAGRAAAEGVLGALNSAASIQFAKRLVTNSSAYDVPGANTLLAALDPAPTECSSTADTDGSIITCEFAGTDYEITVSESDTNVSPAKATKGW